MKNKKNKTPWEILLSNYKLVPIEKVNPQWHKKIELLSRRSFDGWLIVGGQPGGASFVFKKDNHVISMNLN